MQDFIARANIRRFTKMLAVEPDAQKRKSLLLLLGAELRKLPAYPLAEMAAPRVCDAELQAH